jgi:stearoyl-CoA desaturase (Delta-9 desaturase)
MSLAKEHKITLRKHNYLEKQQYIHAVAINIIPLLGTIVAFAIAFRLGIGALEIELLLSMYTLTLIGISIGFHRYFAHCAFQTNVTLRVILAILGSMACQGPVIYWVSNHRRHHQFSDQPEDPHSPHWYENRSLSKAEGLWHAQIRWTFSHKITNSFFFCKDLLHDPLVSKINSFYYFWVMLSILIPSIVGGIVTKNSYGILLGFLWGGCVRIFFSYHFTNSINSLTHLYGNRPFDTQEHSRNILWLAIPTFGEAWHNNHHAFPSSAKFGLEWWQLDVGYLLIRTLELSGVIWNVKTPTAKMIKTKSVAHHGMAMSGEESDRISEKCQ